MNRNNINEAVHVRQKTVCELHMKALSSQEKSREDTAASPANAMHIISWADETGRFGVGPTSGRETFAKYNMIGGVDEKHRLDITVGKDARKRAG